MFPYNCLKSGFKLGQSWKMAPSIYLDHIRLVCIAIALSCIVFEIIAVKWEKWLSDRPKLYTWAPCLVPHLEAPEDISPKCEMTYPKRGWTSMQNFTRISYCAARNRNRTDKIVINSKWYSLLVPYYVVPWRVKIWNK